MLFVIEAVVACLVFTLLVASATHQRREAFANDYPPVVADKLRSRGLIAEKPPTKKADILRKLFALICYTILLALLLRYVNGITSFMQAALTAYGLWLVVDWYDFLVVDILFAPFDKFYKLSGVSAFDKEAVAFHFKGSVRGMILGLPSALLVGILAMLL